MRVPPLLLCAVFTTAITATGAESQGRGYPEPGAHVRIMPLTPDSAWITGRYDGMREGRISLRNTHESLWLQPERVARMQVEAGTNPLGGLLGGALAGALVVHPIFVDREPPYDNGTRRAAGAVLGALVGLAVSAIPTWHDAVPPGRDLFAELATYREVVRVRAPAWPVLVGPVEAATSEAFVMMDERLGRVEVPRATMRAVEYRSKGNRARQGAFVGAGIGIVVAALERGKGSVVDEHRLWYDSVALGAGVGVLAGGGVGFLLPRSVWRAAPLH